MSLPLVPLAILGAAAVGLGYVVLHQGEKLPPELEGPFQDLAAHGTDADAIDQVATKLESLGYTKHAATLRARSALLRGGAKPAPSPSAPATPPAAPVTPPAPSAPSAPIAPAPPAPAPAAPAAPAAPTAQFMKVTTHDPPPSGDLALRSAPSDGAGVIGAAEKDSVVTVKGVSPDGLFIQVEALNPAGRRASATGWAHAAFLTPTNPMASSGRARTVGIGAALASKAKPAGGKRTQVAAPSLAIRSLPTYAAATRAVLMKGTVLRVISTLSDRKHDASAPGPGGWALVEAPEQKIRGWAPTEWLVPPGGAS